MQPSRLKQLTSRRPDKEQAKLENRSMTARQQDGQNANLGLYKHLRTFSLLTQSLSPSSHYHYPLPSRFLADASLQTSKIRLEKR